MTEQQNPYQAPEAELIEAASGGELTLVDPQKNPIGAGWAWIAQGFGLFKKSPGLWVGIIIVWFILMMVLAFIPFIGQLASYVLGPIFMAGFVLGCRELDQGGELRFDHLFAGFSNNTGQLILVGVLYLVGIIIAVIPGVLVMGAGMATMFRGGQPAPDTFDGTAFAIGMLLIFAVMIPVFMAYWFAPALVVLHDKPAFEAMKLSFKGCLRNILPYTWYSMVAVVLCILAVIPLGLGYLVLMPTLIATFCTAYRSIFTEQ